MKKGIASGYRLIFGYLGIFLIFIGAICLVPLLLLIAYPEEYYSWAAFAIPGLSSIAVGVLLFLLIAKREKSQLGKFQDSILLVLIWLCAILINAIPFMLRGIGTGEIAKYGMNFTDAVFETTSGYATCGLTVFFSYNDAVNVLQVSDYQNLPQLGYHLYTMYRSLLLFFGGVGLVLIVSSAISDRYGLKLYTAEGHNDKLMPNLAKSARMILLIYVAYIVLGALAYWLLGGMEIFDSFCHSVAAIATGGFSTYPGGLPEIIANGGVNSITGWAINGTAINIVSIILMILGSTNFVIHLFLFRGKFKKIFKDCEIRFFLLICIIFIPLFTVSIFNSLSQIGENNALATSFEEGIFLFVSSMTTTGFNTATDIVKLGQGAILLSIIVMTIGGGMGSTAGAIKQYRFVIAFKALYWSIRDRLSNKNYVFPHHVYRLGEDKEVSQSEIFEAYGYIILYITVSVVCTLTMVILGQGNETFSVTNCYFEFANAISSAGLTIGVSQGTGLPVANVKAIRWILTFGMFVGRLEILPVYFAIFRGTRDLLRKETN